MMEDNEFFDELTAIAGGNLSATENSAETWRAIDRRISKRWWQRWPFITAVVGAIVIGICVPATAGYTRKKPAISDYIYCYGTTKDTKNPSTRLGPLQASVVIGPTGLNDQGVLDTPISDPALTARYAVSVCADKWALGAVKSSPPYTTLVLEDPTVPFTAPPLAPCVLPEGAVAVVPGTEQTCLDLGLPVAQLP